MWFFLPDSSVPGLKRKSGSKVCASSVQVSFKSVKLTVRTGSGFTGIVCMATRSKECMHVSHRSFLHVR